MQAFKAFGQAKYEKGKAEGIELSLKRLANNLIRQNNNKLTQEEALKQAQELLKP